MLLTATRFRLSGFSDRPHFTDKVTIVGFVWGFHQDAFGYDRSGECTLAVHFVDDDLKLEASPVSWFKINGVVSDRDLCSLEAPDA